MNTTWIILAAIILILGTVVTACAGLVGIAITSSEDVRAVSAAGLAFGSCGMGFLFGKISN